MEKAEGGRNREEIRDSSRRGASGEKPVSKVGRTVEDRGINQTLQLIVKHEELKFLRRTN